MANAKHMSYLRSRLDGKTVVLLTQTGSRLYGLHNKRSDYDWYAVVLEGTKTAHKVVGDEDVTVVPLSHYLDLVARGVPQALEALWSRNAYRDERYAPLLAALRPNLWQARYRHLSEQGNFNPDNYSAEEIAYRTRKAYRHKARLALQWLAMLQHGTYNPELTPENRGVVARAGNDPEFAWRVHDEVEAMLPPAH